MAFTGSLKLSANNIKRDPFMKQCYKDFVNALTGKFSQRRTGSKTQFVNSQASLEKLFHQEKSELVDISCYNNICECDMDLKVTNAPNRNANLVYGALITAAGRSHLFSCLIKLMNAGMKPHYCDTDSIFFSRKKDDSPPLLVSPAFGHFKAEYDCSKVASFYSIAKKSTCISLKDEKGNQDHVLKVKGLSFNYAHGNALSEADFKNLLDSYIQEQETSVTITQARKRKCETTISIYKLTSLLQFGRILNKHNLTTYAFGELSS